MKIYDISLAINTDMLVWPNETALQLERVSSIDAGAQANVSRLAIGVHCGTHVDAPHHFLNDHRTVESLPLDILTGPAQVVQIPDQVDVVSAEVLEHASIPPGTLRLLLKTRNSHLWKGGARAFSPDFVAVDLSGAGWIVEHGIRLIGIDYLSIAPFGDGGPAHRALLKPGVIILEGIDLSMVPPASYELVCLPLKLVRSDGAPVRAILVKK
jgi:arylformamidase